MKTQLITGLILALGIALFIPRASAQTPTCLPVFGGGQSCAVHPDLSINKQVQESDTKEFRENLTAMSNYFTTNQQINFRIIVRNTSTRTISNISITDVLPAPLTYRTSNGTYDTKTRAFTGKIDKLDKGQTKTYTLTTAINEANLPANMTPVCVINQATVTQGGKTGTDNTTFCISSDLASVEGVTGQPPTPGQTKGGLAIRPSPTLRTQSKGGLPIYSQKQQSQTPATGPETLALLSIPSLAGLGYLLRRKTK